MVIDLTAISLTPAARDWLTQTKSARVLNIFDRACNLINQDNAILALVTSERGLTPFAMVVVGDSRTPFRVVSAESAVSIRASQLSVGSLQIKFANVALWNPIPDWPALRQLFADDPSRLDWLAVAAQENLVEGSLLDLYPSLSPNPSPPGRGAGVRDAMLERARRGATELVQGLLVGSSSQCLIGVKALAGLGGGLTPAGDDFIVGAMFAMWAGLYGPGTESFCDPIVNAAAPLTTTLSAAYLRAAARGECIAHWHAVLDALLRSDEAALKSATLALTSIGHTSGADSLAGFLAPNFLKAQSDSSNGILIHQGGEP
ncbi:MAG: DUF2877 domain-containing protein [Chloroflexi bacterium]|nr:DUF2877 domain-containing protein [Chloroflexota bacterium]